MHTDQGLGCALGWTKSWAWTTGQGLPFSHGQAACSTGGARPGFVMLQMGTL